MYYFAHDRGYSTTALMNTLGSVVESYDYKIYNKRTASAGYELRLGVNGYEGFNPTVDALSKTGVLGFTAYVEGNGKVTFQAKEGDVK